MKFVIVLSALVLSSSAHALECGRALGSPGFVVTLADEQAARDTVMFQCETYRLQGREGYCSNMGCQQTSAGFTCTAMLTVCQ